ncbi:MAG: glycoside hydrolase family 15 protein, partial [Phycisphaerae bacterium]
MCDRRWPEAIAAHRPFDHLRATRRFWRHWASKLQYDGPWRHDVQRSALTLKMLQFAPTGAMVAAPTTSLPVCPGGQRNWDYRFSWTRDSAMAIRAMNLIGYHDEAVGFFHFVRDTIERHDRLDLMVTIGGADVPAETILDHLCGHAGRGPVRIGNAAAAQIQHDIVGPLLDAAFLYEHAGGVLTLSLWRDIRQAVDAAIGTIGEPDHGIWEPRARPGHHVHSKLMTWVALDRALHLAPLFAGDPSLGSWRTHVQSLRREILAHGYDRGRGTFVGEYGGDSVDA